METVENVTLHFSNNTHTYQHRTFSLTLVPGIDVEAVESLLTSYVDCGWVLGAVHVSTDMDHSRPPTVVKLDAVADVLDFWEILENNDHSVTRILAYGELYGWDNVGDWEDPGYFEAWSNADCAEEMYYEFHEELMHKVDDDMSLSIDWEHTARQLSMGGASFHERNGRHCLFI